MKSIRNETKLSDKEQRRVDYETACIEEKEYYARQEISFVKKTMKQKRLKGPAVCAPANMNYLRRNRWIKGVEKCFTRK